MSLPDMEEQNGVRGWRENSKYAEASQHGNYLSLIDYFKEK